MAGYTTPYVRPRYDSDGLIRLAEFIARSGRDRAEGLRRGGEISAQGIQQAGQAIAGGLQAYGQEREQAPIRARQMEMADLQLQNAKDARASQQALSKQDAAFLQFLASNSNTETGEFQLPDPRGVMAILGPERGAKAFDGLKAFAELQSGQVADARGNAGRLAMGLKAMSPTLQAQFWPEIRTAAVKAGLGTEEHIPEQPDANFLDGVIAWASGKAPDQPEAFTLSPGQQRFGADGQPIASVAAPTPAAPNPTEASLAAAAANGDRNAARALQLLRQQHPTQGTADPGPLETIIGPDGKPIRVARRDAVGKAPASGTEKPSSGMQKRVLNFFNRAQQADADLEGMEPQIQELGLMGQTWQAIAPNFAQTQLGQSYTAAQRAFTEARLRKDSGAAIPPQEFENDRKTYFAQPGDSKETLEQKRRARATMLASLAFESGQALGEYVGDVDEAKRIVESYKTRAAKPAGKHTIGRFEIEVAP